MISLLSVQSVRDMLALMMAYVFSVIFVGFFQALFAKKMGDDTAERYGFLSLNPNAYVDWIGMMCLFLFCIGWGRVVPINRNNFHGKHGTFWFLAVYTFSLFAHIILAIIAATIAVCALSAAGKVVDGQTLISVAQHSSYSLAFFMILGALINLNIVLAMIHIIFNLVDLVFVFFFHRPVEFIEYRDPYAIATILLVCIFLGDAIVQGLYALVSFVSSFLAQLISCLF